MTEGENTLGGGRGGTRICSVLFVDIVGYSKKTNAEQLILKRQFVESWTAATKDIPADDVMVVDAGDGAALTSLVEPEDTLRVALRLAALLSGEGALELPMQLRMGINFGPVQLSRDVHGKDCIVGDAINMAQRVMSFAEGGQITISRSYYDAIVPLSRQYGEMFRYLGKRSDKHGRQHDIYVFGSPSQPSAKGMAPSDNFVRHGEEVAAAQQASGAESGPGGLAASLIHGVKIVFGWALGTVHGLFRRIITVAVVLLFLYELLVLVPLSGYPGAVKTELGQQLEFVKLLAVGEWKEAMAEVSQAPGETAGAPKRDKSRQ